MIIEKIHKRFKVLLDKVDSEAYSEFLPQEIDDFLNKAIDSFIKTRYGRNNTYKKGFETLQKRTEDLKAIVTTVYTSFTEELLVSDSKVYKINLKDFFTDLEKTIQSDDTYMFYVSSLSTLKEDNCNFMVVNKVSNHDRLGIVLKDPFNKPSSYSPIILFEDNNLLLFSGKSSLESFRLTMVKNPAQVCLGTYKGLPKVECDLSDHTHEEIINLAVEIALESIGSPRINTLQGIKNQSE